MCVTLPCARSQEMVRTRRSGRTGPPTNISHVLLYPPDILSSSHEHKILV